MSRIETMLAYIEGIADNDYYGYSQEDRWGHDRDCSSVIYDGARHAGYDVPSDGYTGTLRQDFINAGWSCVEYDGNPYDLDRGDIILARNAKHGHVEIALSSDTWVGAHSDYDGRPGDSSGREINRCSPYHIGEDPYDWDYVLSPPPEGGQSQPQVEPATDGMIPVSVLEDLIRRYK